VCLNQLDSERVIRCLNDVDTLLGSCDLHHRNLLCVTEECGEQRISEMDRANLIGIIGFTGLAKREAQAGSQGRGDKSGGRGHGGQVRGGGRGAADPSMKADQSLIRTLLSNRGQIRRQIKLLPNGIETLTATDSPQLRTILVQHVQSMKKRVEQAGDSPIILNDGRERSMTARSCRFSLRSRPAWYAFSITTTNSSILAGLVR